MKLVIQVPCFNEEENLAKVLSGIPKKISGISEIQIVVIEDGSNDKSLNIAKKYNVDVLQHQTNLGLGKTFKDGVRYALKNRADILVNIDADNQYPAKYIPKIIQPILNQKSDLVIGNRVPWKNKSFSLLKRLFQYIGSRVIKKFTGADVPDPISGFRAYSKDAIVSLNMTTQFSYVLDSIMQISKKGLRINSIKIKTNNTKRKSRLYNNIFHYIYRSAFDILYLFFIYKPFKTFLWLALIFFVPGLLICIRFLVLFLQGIGQGHIQSLIAAAILLFVSTILFVLGLIGELLKINRTLSEKQIEYLRKEIYYNKDEK